MDRFQLGNAGTERRDKVGVVDDRGERTGHESAMS
jgi:hypothetical protein